MTLFLSRRFQLSAVITLCAQLLSSTASAGDFDNFQKLPKYIKLEILKYLETNDIASLSLINKAFHQLYRSDEAQKIPAVRNLYLVNNLTNISSWPKEQIEELLQKKDIVSYLLLRKITENSLTAVKELLKEEVDFDPKRDAPRAFIAVYLAHYMVNFRYPFEKAGSVAYVAAWECAQNNNPNGARYHAWQAFGASAWHRAPSYNAFDGAINAVWKAARNSTHNSTRPTKHSLKKQTKAALRKLDKKESTEIGQTIYAIVELLTLNSVRKPNSKYFKETFQAAYKTLSEDTKLNDSVTIEKVREDISQKIDTDKRVSPFIIELEFFLDEVERLCNPEL